MKRIHIVGCGPRTGTTLITELVSTCFDVDLYTEHEDPIFKLPPKKAEVYVTKNPGDTTKAKTALRFMPTLYVIYMIRDPRDMIVSRHNISPDCYWVGMNTWTKWSPYGRELKDHPRFITVRYEDLVTKPDQIQAVLMERLPFLKKKANFSDYHMQANPSQKSLDALVGLRPVSSTSVGNWRNHLPRILGQIVQHGSITDDLIHYGYENDRDWEHVLDDVEPDFSESYWPEYGDSSKPTVSSKRLVAAAVYAAFAHSSCYGLVKTGDALYRVVRRRAYAIARRSMRVLRKSGDLISRPYIPVAPLPAKNSPRSRHLIIRPDMLKGREKKNVNVPSIVRVPDWVEQPLGRYYLYFASHVDARYIRMAYADAVEGPWKIHPGGVLHSLDMRANYQTIAGPDVHVDEERKQIRMYFHAVPRSRKRVRSLVATSTDGIDFQIHADIADTFYFRVFRHQGEWYALSKGGRLFRSNDGLSKFVHGPDVFPHVPRNTARYNAPGSVRHVSIEAFDDYADVYYTRIGDAPEIILKSRMELNGDWQTWRAGPPQEVMRPEHDWEGGGLPVELSKSGKANQPVHQLRDPDVFRDEDGARYLVYAAAGEHGIGVARLD